MRPPLRSNLHRTFATGFTTPSGTNATSITATVNAPNISVFAAANLGQNLQVDGESIGLGAAPPSNGTLTVTSNSANVLLANGLAGPFSQSITLSLSQGSFSVPTFSMQGLASSGTVQLTATATGYNNGTVTVTLTPSGVVWNSGNFSTTTFSPDNNLSLVSGQLNATTLTFQSTQNIRTGLTVNVSVTSSAPTVGTIVTSPAVFSGDNSFATTTFHPLTSGTTNLVITTPTGFTTPSGTNATSITATVNAPNISVFAAANLGQNLQVDGESIGLGAAPPSNGTLTVTSNSANVLLANGLAGPFSQSITLPLSQGSFSVPAFSMQGLASSGTVQLTATATGYNNGTATVTLTPSGFVWNSGNFSTTTFSPDNNLSLVSGQLNPATLTFQSTQNVRNGLTVNVSITSSIPTVGTIVTSPVVFSGNNSFGSTTFHPLTAGTTNLVIATPTGFTTPSGANATSITSTVTAPTLRIFVSANLGQNLQVDGESIGLGAAPPNNATLTLSSSSSNLLLATTVAGPFSQSITLPLLQGSFSVPTFSIQGLASSGTAQLTAQAPGYSDGIAVVTFTPSGFVWNSGNFSTTTFSPDNNLSLVSGQ